MAKALLSTVEKQITVTEIAGVNLHLSIEEAIFLANVLAPISGVPHETARLYREHISGALANAGFSYCQNHESIVTGNLTCPKGSLEVIKALAKDWQKGKM